MQSPQRNILVVCTGNVCRSPMAMVYLRYKAEQENMPAIIQSAGILDLGGAPASEPAQVIVKRDHLDLSIHRAQPVCRYHVEHADFILVMELWHMAWIQSHYAFLNFEIDLLSRYLDGGDPDHQGIPDPYGSNLETYASVWFLIKHALDRWWSVTLGTAPKGTIIKQAKPTS